MPLTDEPPLRVWRPTRELPEAWAALLDPDVPLPDHVEWFRAVGRGDALLPLGLLLVGAASPALAAAEALLAGRGLVLTWFALGAGVVSSIVGWRRRRRFALVAAGRIRAGCFLSPAGLLLTSNPWDEVCLIPKTRVRDARLLLVVDGASRTPFKKPQLVFAEDDDTLAAVNLPTDVECGNRSLLATLRAWADLPGQAPLTHD